MKGKDMSADASLATTVVRMELSGGSVPYRHDYLRESPVETVSTDQLISDMLAGHRIYHAQHITPAGEPHQGLLSRVIGVLYASGDRQLRALWQVNQYLHERFNAYTHYSSAGECPAILPDGEHKEIGRRLAGIREKIKRTRELFESGVRKRFSDIPVNPKQLRIDLCSGWRV